MSKFEFLKVGYDTGSFVREVSQSEFESKLASPDILDRLNKFASTIRAIAPRSDDFLYFTIIFMKSAEAALIDEVGNPKKVGSETAWGYFDDDWKWHGNVKCHKNSNADIFPESELRKAAKNWIGRPLCVDHKSDSVDGVRGIVLDTYYDEKLKQVVGLCALDKVNYPDLARKVATGVVRYGSMGTAVATSVCTECGKKAASPKEYCSHVATRQAWGEINVGLNPIEYSLVVQPAEPGAILLRCFASIEKHADELSSYGFDVKAMKDSLDEERANDLDVLLNRVCGPDGCSLDQRSRIIKGYLSTNGFTKAASISKKSSSQELAKAMAAFASATGLTAVQSPDAFLTFFRDSITPDVEEAFMKMVGSEQMSQPEGETFSSGQNSEGTSSIINKDNQGVSGTGTETSGFIAAPSDIEPDTFNTGVGPESYIPDRTANNKQKIKNDFNSIVEEIMDEATLRRRAEMRRKMAYHQGGSAPDVEPSTFKDESAKEKKIRETEDRHMTLSPAGLGGDTGMAPGDKELKEKLLRAKNQSGATEKRAYFFGGSDGVEPKTYVSEDYKKFWDMDKHMHQTGSMGGEKGMFPGDDAIKQKQKRASQGTGALSTKLRLKRNSDGGINKAASAFEVYKDNRLVVATTAGTIFGSKLADNWDFLTTKEYSKAVIAAIKQEGLDKVAKNLTKTAQAAPMDPMAGAAPMDPMAGAAPMDPMAGAAMDPMADAGMDLLGGEELLGEADDLGAEETPQVVVDNALIDMEAAIDSIRDALGKLGNVGKDVNVDINLGGESAEAAGEAVKLSHKIRQELKVALAEVRESADELALLAETFDRYRKLSASQKRDVLKIARAALKDSARLKSQASALITVANTVHESAVKLASSRKPASRTKTASKSPKTASKSPSELELSALELRRKRRAGIVRTAMIKTAEDYKEEEGDHENDAHDGIGMRENAGVAGVTSDTVMDVALRQPKGGDHKAAPSKGNADAKQHSGYSSSARTMAEKGTPSVSKADDGEDMKDVAKGEAKKQVKKHEDKMHGKKEDDAQDSLSPVQAKLSKSFMAKKAEEEREAYRIKLRRAYDVGMEMQRKGLLAKTRPALDSQVDEMMEFDDKAFESFKRSIANAKPVGAVKTASDLGEVNIGITGEDEQPSSSKKVSIEALASLFK